MVDEEGKPLRIATELDEDEEGYACLACGRIIPGQQINGMWLAVHDEVDHSFMTWEEEGNPQ